jgi:hypothetical protein
MGIEMKGFGDLRKTLRRLQKNAEALDGTHEVPLDNVLSPAFLRKHTQFTSLENLLAVWNVDGDEFDDLSAEKKDALTTSTTSFRTWDDFVAAGTAEYARKQLFK